jgi:hypothetical protein
MTHTAKHARAMVVVGTHVVDFGGGSTFATDAELTGRVPLKDGPAYLGPVGGEG